VGTVVTAVVLAGVASVVALTLVVFVASVGARAWTRRRDRLDA
jgi:hypothetical protein